MKTNQNLVRRMGEFEVIQRTEDGMFNATTLLQQWNGKSGQQKGVHHYFDQNSTKEFISTIQDREFSNMRNSAKNSLSMVYEKKRGIQGSTWMHPLLFIDFAMWINPSFKYDVLKFVYDELIKYRNDAGDAYREMCEQVARISDKKEIATNIKKTAEAINYISQNQHDKMIRNKADEDQMKEYVRIEKEITMLIKKGFIKTFNDLMAHLRAEWKDKYQPAVLR